MKTIGLVLLSIALFTFGASAQETGSREPNTAAPAPTKKAVFRPTKDQITQVQTKLKGANLYSGEASGKLGSASRDAIKNWQGTNGLRAHVSRRARSIGGSQWGQSAGPSS